MRRRPNPAVRFVAPLVVTLVLAMLSLVADALGTFGLGRLVTSHVRCVGPVHVGHAVPTVGLPSCTFIGT